MANFGSVLYVNLQQHAIEEVEEVISDLSPGKGLSFDIYSVGVEKLSRVLESVKPYLFESFEDGRVQ